MADPNNHSQYQAVRRVLWGVLFANLTITVLKITLGMMTGALSIVADGFHSLVDTSSNLIGLAAIRLADRPADERYPYGYQKYETLGALAIGGMMLAASWEILQSIVERLINGATPEVSWLTIGIVAFTLPINIGVVVLETRLGRKLNSEILIADATHTKTDLYVTGSVLLSLGGVWLGWAWLDLLVAMIVVGLILRAAFGILRSAAGALADVVGVDAHNVEQIAREVVGVRFVHNIRSRGTAETVFVDLHVKVDPAMSTSQAHAVASEVERRLQTRIKNVVDAVVHIEPARFEDSNNWDRIAYGLRQIAEGMGLGLHDLHIHVDPNGEYIIDMDLEISGEKTLHQAHQLAEDFENRAKRYWPQAKRVNTHMEPLASELFFPQLIQDEALNQKISDLLDYYADIEGVTEIYSHQVDDHLHVSLKLCMDPNLSLADAHANAERIKRQLYAFVPEMSRVVIHVEPFEQSSN